MYQNELGQKWLETFANVAIVDTLKIDNDELSSMMSLSPYMGLKDIKQCCTFKNVIPMNNGTDFLYNEKKASKQVDYILLEAYMLEKSVYIQNISYKVTPDYVYCVITYLSDKPLDSTTKRFNTLFGFYLPILYWLPVYAKPYKVYQANLSRFIYQETSIAAGAYNKINLMLSITTPN